MENGISEALKIKHFWGSMPPDPANASHLQRSFSLCFLCVPRRKNHATPLLRALKTYIKLINLREYYDSSLFKFLT